jgi:two-component system sensor histidine kinase/response regulator
MNGSSLAGSMEQRVQHLLRKQQQRHYAAIDRMFGVLMLIQWAAAVAAAYWISPLTWEGLSHTIHPHVWLAIGFGGAIASLPAILDFCYPGRTLTRHVNSVAQVLFSILLIHVTGGRIETHFHVFGSLAFLACYRDWKVLIPATLIVAVDHFVRGIWFPESVFGVASASYWRWLEHAGWVLFEDVFLTIACIQGVSEMRSIAARAAELEDTDRWKKTILEAALDAVVSMDGKGRITEWNSKAESIFGWTAKEAIGRSLDELIIPPAYREQHRRGLRVYLETGVGPVLSRRIEVTALRRDGTEFPVELAITPIHSHNELNFCGFIRDITARNRAERELRNAKDAAESANHAKSTFLANMSHEIRTPLNGILGFTELLRRGADRGDDKKRREFLETIDRSGRHLLTVINDVLDLSKIEAGQLSIERISCAPHELLAEVVSILRVAAQQKGLTLDYFWTGNVPELIQTDPARLRQILMNLVGNAIKFTEHGSVTIIANLICEDDGPSFLKISVKDTGMGISPEKLDSIFEPFVQGDSSVTRRFGGTGLGLSICKRLSQLLGGFVQVQSQPGLGSNFTFTVDAGHPQFGTNSSPRSGDVIPSPSTTPSSDGLCLNGCNILLIEDGEINRKLIHIVLEEAGATVALAENGEQGLCKALSQSFDAVLLDMQMPVMDGYVAAAEMRKAGVTCPIIALTAHSMAGDAEKCLQAGCSHFLSKPVESEQLVSTLVAALPKQTLPAKKRGDRNARKNDHSPLHSKLAMERPNFRNIVRDYVDSLTEKMDALETACREEDLERLHELTHALKGSGGTAGYPDLSTAADRVLQKVLNSEVAEVPKEIDGLRKVVSRVIAGRPA